MNSTKFEHIPLNRKTLLFPPDIEAIFLSQGLSAKIAFFTAGVFLLCGFDLIFQYYLFNRLLPVPSLLMLPLPVLLFFLKITDHGKYIDLFYCFSLFFTGISLISIIIVSPDRFVCFSALIFLVISGFIFFKIRYLLAGITGYLTVVVYGLSAFFFTDIPLDIIFHNTFFLLFTALIGMTAGYTIEYHTRMVFLKTSLLKQISKETKQMELLRKRESIRTNKSLELEILAHTEAEAQLKESEEKYRNLVVCLPDGIFIVQDKKIVFLNPSMENLTGFDAQKLLNTDVSALLTKDSVDDVRIETENHEFFIKQDGQIVYIEKSVVEIVYNLKPALLFTVRDITEKVLAQREKQRLQRELEKARKMEAFGILAGGVAHDLNNVLSGLVSAPDILLMDLPKDSNLRIHVNAVKDAGQRASAIADELVTMVRGAAKMLEPVQFNDVIEGYLISPEFNRMKYGYKQVKMIKKLDPELFFIQASAIHMRKIVMNLISNAVEAAGPDGGTVAVETGSVEFHNQSIKGYKKVKNGRYIKFSVMNTGLGISKEDIDHIFEPFYSKKILGRSGTGLGLSIVWNAVHDHNGYIHVGSRKGQTHFTLYLPIAGNLQTSHPSREVYTLADFAGNNEKILVVDDLISQQKITANILKRLGYRVQTVSSGEDAICYITHHAIDLVVLDMVMAPGLSGLETYEQLLLIDPEIKAIITSGYPKTREVDKALEMGAADFIKKPFPLQRIGLAIKKELLNRKK